MQREQISPAASSGLVVGIVVARFNELITERLLSGALSALESAGVSHVRVAHVPGSFELPLVAKQLAAAGGVDAVVALGAVIRGDTDHYQHVSEAATRGIAAASLDTGVPIAFGVLTCDTLEQALDRVGGKAGNKGADAARSAVETALVLRAIAGA